MIVKYKDLAKYIYDKIEIKDVWHITSCLYTARYLLEMKFGHLVCVSWEPVYFIDMLKNMQDIEKYCIESELPQHVLDTLDMALMYYDELTDYVQELEDVWYQKTYEGKEDK